MVRAYAILCAVLGVVMILFGAQLLVGFVTSLLPDAPPPMPFPIGPSGLYFAAFSGSCLVAWGGCLVAAARGARGPDPRVARAVGTWTALGLVLNAFYRLLVWFFAELEWLGSLTTLEASVFLVLALAFVWLRPPRATPEPA